MELIYSMRRKPLKCEPPNFDSTYDPEVTRPICTISTANIIAFSSPTELSDTDGDTWGGHVYVCDLDTPWDAHKVTSTSYPVSALEWDMEGKQLLVATTVGDVSIYTQKEYLLNEWTCIYTASFPGEHIISSSFFHNGRRIVAVDKKPDAPITERFQMLRTTPTLKGFGGVACEGACVVTATGLLGVLVPAGGAKALTACESLRASRDHVTAASIAHKNGKLAVAALCVSAGGRCCVRCYRCSVTADGNAAPQLARHPLPTVHLPLGDISHLAPASITWCMRDDTDSLLIAGTTLSLWKCTERSHQIHKLLSKGPLQGSTTPGGGPKPTTDSFNTLVWQKAGAWPIEGGPCVCVCGARCALAAVHCALCTPAALHLLPRHTHHYLCSRPVITNGAAAAAEAAAGGTPPKKTKYGNGSIPSVSSCARVSSVSLSQLGGCAVCVDTHGALHVYKASAWDTPLPLAVQHATTLLEYCMITGYDCLDILMTLKNNLAEPVYERFTETFLRQPQAFQQYYFHSWLKLRIALCRSARPLQGCGSALSCLQSARCLWAAAGLALRPDDRPDDRPLAALLDDHAGDQDKNLLALEAKTEPPAEAAWLQPLRLPLRRALDMALTALLSLAHHHAHQIHPQGYELWADGAAVSVLRKLAVLARGSGGGGCRLAEALSRPLARLATCGAPKQDLIDECATLTAQWGGAPVWEALPRCSVSAPHSKPCPLYFEYGVEPEGLRYTPEPPAYVQCETTPSTTMDSIRYMYLGGGWKPARWRQCSRCGSRALPAAQPSRHPLQRAYDARFLSACRCGGKWTLFSNI